MAIIIAYDDSDGWYDHLMDPNINESNAADDFLSGQGICGKVTNSVKIVAGRCGHGPRLPLLVISPYARTNYIAKTQGSQSSVVKFVDAVFNLPPLALLPDELNARNLGEKMFGQANLGPEDAITSGIDDLTDAFSPSRLLGTADPLPPGYVTISEALIHKLPQNWGFGGCQYLGLTPVDRWLGIVNTVPSDFNPRPSTNPN